MTLLKELCKWPANPGEHPEGDSGISMLKSLFLSERPSELLKLLVGFSASEAQDNTTKLLAMIADTKDDAVQSSITCLLADPPSSSIPYLVLLVQAYYNIDESS